MPNVLPNSVDVNPNINPALRGGIPPGNADPAAADTGPISPRHAAARELAGKGIPVFPCVVGGKKPAVEGGFTARTTDKALIDFWWGTADYNIGIVPEDRGLCVVDIDPKNRGDVSWAALVAEHGEPKTFSITTPSGGRHLYFKGSLPASAGRENSGIAKGVDTRGRVSYCLYPPSVVDGRPYTVNSGVVAELPVWIAEAVERRDVVPRAAPADVELDTPFAIETAVAEIRRQLSQGIPEEGDGSDDRTFRLACRLKDYGLSAGKVLEMLSQHWAPHFDQDWLGAKVASAFKNGQNEPGSDAPVPDAAAFAHVERPKRYKQYITEPDGGEPLDLFGTIAPDPVLTRAMLPDAPAIEYAFDVAERQGVDPAITVSAMLATCAAAIDDGIRIRRKRTDPEHTERAHANFLIAAPVGGGKTPAIGAMTAPLKAIQARWNEEHNRNLALHASAMQLHKVAERVFLKRYEGDPESLNVAKAAEEAPQAPQKPVRRRLVINNATIEGVRDALRHDPHGVLNEQDEMTGFIAGFDAYRPGKGGADRAFWLQTDNGGPFLVDRAEKAEGGGGAFTVPNLSACFIGGIQPNKLRELARTLSDDGFIQRSFVVFASSGGQEQDREANGEAKEAYRNLLERLTGLKPTWEVEIEAGGHAIRREVEQIAADLITMPTTPEAMRGHLSKWPGKFARLVLLFHVIERVSQGEPIECPVSAATVQRARDFMVRFILPHAIRFYHKFFEAADVAGTDARWIAGHILAHPSTKITAREIGRAYHDADAARVEAAMSVLVNARWVEAPVENTIKLSRYWPVNPAVHAMFANLAAAEKARRAETVERIREAEGRLREVGAA